MIRGVSEKELEIIKEILKPFREKYSFYCYGSRVKGNYRELSDLDMLVSSQDEINISDIDTLKNKFDESKLPYVVNLAYNLEERFYNTIKQDLIQI